MAAEVQRRGLERAQRKGYLCGGQKYNGPLYERHLAALGFIGILDFLHLLAYRYGAAQAVEGEGAAPAWAPYESWLRLAGAGRVAEVRAGLRAGCAKLGPAPPGCPEGGPRKVVAAARG
jgi:hypothetical protein